MNPTPERKAEQLTAHALGWGILAWSALFVAIAFGGWVSWAMLPMNATALWQTIQIRRRTKFYSEMTNASASSRTTRTR